VVKFYDLYLAPNLLDKSSLSKIVAFAQKLGYHGIAIEGKIEGTFENNPQIRIYRRKTIYANEIKEVKKALRTTNIKNTIIAANFQNRAVASWCARDSRIKILSITLNNIKKLHKNTIKIASRNDTFLEISLFDLLFDTYTPLVKRLSLLSQKVKEIIKLNGKLIISSRATNLFQMRCPKDVIALTSMFDLDKSMAKTAISENPQNIINELVEN